MVGIVNAFPVLDVLGEMEWLEEAYSPFKAT
jgi:hypothetical protein